MNMGIHLLRAQNLWLSMTQPDDAIARADRMFFMPKRHESKSWEEAAEAQGRRMTLKNGSSVLVWGEGIPVLMMHGWEGRATQMAGFAAPLNQLGFQVIALDAPAHGKSTGERANPARFVESMQLAEQAFGPFYALIGHSMGAGCVLYAAAEGMQAEKLVAIAGPASFKTVSRRFARFIGLTHKVTNDFVAHVESEVGIDFDKIDLAARVPQLKQSTLVIHDSGDAEIPYRDAQRLSHHLRNGRLFRTDGLGHRAIMRAPLVIDTVTNFIGMRDDQFLVEAI